MELVRERIGGGDFHRPFYKITTNYLIIELLKWKLQKKKKLSLKENTSRNGSSIHYLIIYRNKKIDREHGDMNLGT